MQTSTGFNIHSLSANEFEVQLDGEVVKGVFRISGLVPFKLDVKPSMTKVVHEPFKLAKMVQRDPEIAFNRWLRETIAATDDLARPSRTLEILAIDDGEETRRWTIKGAWISRDRLLGLQHRQRRLDRGNRHHPLRRDQRALANGERLKIQFASSSRLLYRIMLTRPALSGVRSAAPATSKKSCPVCEGRTSPEPVGVGSSTSTHEPDTS